MKKILLYGLLASASLVGCQKGDITSNPNQGSTASATLLLNAITSRFAKGGGVIDGETGATEETVWSSTNVHKYSQYWASNYGYYQGYNTYNWSYSATEYQMLKYVLLLEAQAKTQFPSTPIYNVYNGLAKFFKAYSFIWLAERVGDIPMDEAGNSSVLHPTYNTQKQVYQKSLVLLDSANTILGTVISANSNGSTVVDASGDIFGMTYLQWQKIINAYRLRTLISLSKRATDNSDLNVATQIANIVNNTSANPLPTSNSDNLTYKYTTVNSYPLYNNSYSQYANISSTYLSLLTANADPRTFMVATPAPAQIAAGKTVADFSAYVGADMSNAIGTLNTNSTAGKYSYLNYNRYYTSATGANAEGYFYIGYPEVCFNIAEAMNRGYVSGTAKTWYDAGVQASLALYGLTNGATYSVGSITGAALGTVTINLTTFLSNIAYKSGTSGLQQILEQKYISMFLNSPMEGYFNWRRTGIPSFSQGGSGIGTSTNLIPRRWQYPLTEQTENTTNYTSAITSQFGGTDDITQDTWLTK